MAKYAFALTRRRVGVLKAVEQHRVASAGVISPRPARRGVLIACALGGLLLAIGAGLLVATSDHLVDPTGFGLWLAVTVAGWFGAALYWLVRRPGNRLGLVLLAVAVCTVVMSLQGANQPQFHDIGVLADWLFVVVVFYVVFAFPEGRIESRVGWALLGATALERLASYIPSLLFSPIVYSNFPAAACNAACPANGFMIADRPTLADGLFSSETSIYIRLAVRSAICVYLIYRLATATKPRRRALVPVYVPVLIAIAPILVSYVARLGLVHVDAGALSKLSWLGTIGIGALPYGFLLSVVASTLFAAAALKMIVSRLVESPSAAQLRATLADPLDDPSLELGFRLERGGGFVDSSGMPLASTPPPGQSSSPITKNGETVAVILHDAALDTDPELVAAAGQAMLLAIENDRLTDQLRSTTTELHEMHSRIATAGEAERRKVERDLHDGAQQHLVALIIKVGLAREVADPEGVARLDEVRQRAGRDSGGAPRPRPWPLPTRAPRLGTRGGPAHPRAAVGFPGKGRGRRDRPLLRRRRGRRLLLLRGKSPERPQARRVGCDRCDSAVGARSPTLLRDRRRRRRLRRRIGPPRGSRASERVRADRRARREPGARVDTGTGYDSPGEHPSRGRRGAASWSHRPLRLRGSQRLQPRAASRHAAVRL